MMMMACNDGKGHSKRAQHNDDSGRGAITTVHGATMMMMTVRNYDNDDAQWHAAQWRTARTMTSSLHQANHQRPPLLAQYHRSP